MRLGLGGLHEHSEFADVSLDLEKIFPLLTRRFLFVLGNAGFESNDGLLEVRLGKDSCSPFIPVASSDSIAVYSDSSSIDMMIVVCILLVCGMKTAFWLRRGSS